MNAQRLIQWQWGVALGWYGAGALPLRMAAHPALDAESAAVLETIKGLLA